MDYQQTLDYLFGQLPMYQRIGAAAYKADLSYTWKLMDVLGHPYQNFRTIHVAGTNGKGSVSHLIASILQEAGYKTGLYTSPHLVDFRERIKINGTMVLQQEVVTFVDRYREAFEKIGLSFFEWSVGLAFQYFSDQKVEVAVVETGMGGRLDSTNVITPDLSIITNIGLDHTQFLGNTFAAIAAEKAGIIKKHVPVVIGKTQSETKAVFEEKSRAMSAEIYFADAVPLQEFPPSPLKGSYQKENFQTVLTAVSILQKNSYDIPDTAIPKGFGRVIENTGLRGRWETLQEKPRVICDVGHNKAGLAHVTEQLKKEPAGQLHLVLGFVSDKSVGEILGLFPKDAWFYFCQPSVPRRMPVEELVPVAEGFGLRFSTFQSVGEAYHAALGSANADDVIFIGGSTFVVADLLAAL